jgi:uncharacterized repeat protein (TIGR01451 family)
MYRVLLIAVAFLAISAAAVGTMLRSGDDKAAVKLPGDRSPWQSGLVFEENLGQAAEGVRYIGHSAGGALLLMDDRIVLRAAVKVGDLPSDTPHQALGQPPLPDLEVREVVMSFAGGQAVEPSALGELDARFNYYLGNDPERWVEGVPLFAGVEYEDVYPGVDLVFYGVESGLEFDLVLDPGVDPSIVQLQFASADGVDLVDGALVLTTGGAEIRMRVPAVYQELDGERVPVEARLVLIPDGGAGFQVGAYDRDLALVIDPVFEWATYVGGSEVDWVQDIDVDPDGLVFVTGITRSQGLFEDATGPTPGARGSADTDAFVAVFGPDGEFRGGSVFGGSGNERANAVAAFQGDAVAVGGTFSEDFPSDRGPAGQNGFIAPFNDSGNLGQLTIVGGGGEDFLTGVRTVDDGIVFAGSTNSTDIVYVNPLQEHGGGYDGLIGRLDNGDTLSLLSAVGGNGDDFFDAISHDETTGNLGIAGQARSDEVLGIPINGDVGAAAAYFELNPQGQVVNHIIGAGEEGSFASFRNITPVLSDGLDSVLLTGSTNAQNLTLNYSGGGSDEIVCPHGLIEQPGGGTAPEYDAFTFPMNGDFNPKSPQCLGTDTADEFDGRGDAAGGQVYFPVFQGQPDFSDYVIYSKNFPYMCGTDDGSARGLLEFDCPDGEEPEPFDVLSPLVQVVLERTDGQVYTVRVLQAREQVILAGLALGDTLPTGPGSYQQEFGGAFDGMLLSANFDEDYQPDLNVTKIDDPDPVNEGAILTYTFIVNNAGLATATDVVLNDPLPQSFDVVGWAPDICSGTITCNLGTLAPGQVKQVTVQVRPADAGTFPNSVSVSLAEQDADPSDNSDQEETTVLAQAVDVQVGAAAGHLVGESSVLWRFFVWNNGPNDATGVSVNLALDPRIGDPQITSDGGDVEGTFVSIGSLPAGAPRVLIEIQGTVGADGRLSISAEASSAEPDVNPNNNLKDTTLDVTGLFEGYTPAPWLGRGTGGGLLRDHATAVIAALNLAIEPDVWDSVSHYDTGGAAWLTVFRNAPLDSFNTLDELVTGEDYWFFVTQEALMATSEDVDDVPPEP